MDPIEHCYVHVPFCASICPFCPFHVVERGRGDVAAYLARLEVEAAETRERVGEVDLATLYVGGGTPSFLRDDELERLWSIVTAAFGTPRVEASLEVHPVDVAPGRAERWRDLGFTRLSVGVESTDDAVLAALGRRHDAAAALDALDACLASARPGSAATSADVITAVEGQDHAADLARVAATGVGHVSAYVLTIEEGTPFAAQGRVVDPEREGAALEDATTVLDRAGLRRYEVSSHARPGHECRHHLAYWDNRHWVALGPGAWGHEPAAGRWHSVRRHHAPFREWLDGAAPTLDERDALGFAIDGVLAGLRRVDGVDLAALGARAGLDLSEAFAAPLAEVEERGVARRVGTRLVATDEGYRLLDQVAGRFVTP